MNEAKTSILLVDDDRDLLKLITLRLTAAAARRCQIERPRRLQTEERQDRTDGACVVP